MKVAKIIGTAVLLLLTPLPGESAADRVVVVGNDFADALKAYSVATDLPRKDCDPSGDGRWICASFNNPSLSDLIAVPPVLAGPEPVSILAKRVVKTPEVFDGVRMVSSRTELLEAVKTARIVKLSQDIDLSGVGVTSFNGLRDVTIDGSGYSLYRNSGQLDSSMLTVTNSMNVTFRNIAFDDGDDGVIGILNKTPAMVSVDKSTGVMMDRVRVSNSKGYAIYVRQTSGFGFVNSRMEYSGLLGLYIGHGSGDQQSSNILVDNNEFYRNSTNALAVWGVAGGKNNRITNNIFEGNHLFGRFDVAPQFGTGKTGGGQVYLMLVDNLTFSGNTIKDGFCSNCYHYLNQPENAVLDVSGLELSLNTPAISVTRLTVTDNEIYNNNGKGIGQNANSRLDGSTRIYDNRVYGNGINYSLHSDIELSEFTKYSGTASVVPASSITIVGSTSLPIGSLYRPGDFIAVHGDFAPDPDEKMASVAHKMVLDYYGLRRGSDYAVVVGTIGLDLKRSTYISNTPDISNELFGLGDGTLSTYLNAFEDNDGSAVSMALQYKATLDAGNKVYVVEGGPSDFTAATLRKLDDLGFNGNWKNIHLFQHSNGVQGFNELQTNDDNLAFVKNEVTYHAISNGNAGGGNNQTPDLSEKMSAQFLNQLRDHPRYGSAWKIAMDGKETVDVNVKLDASDTVELLWILGIKAQQMASWEKFWSLYGGR